jgi:lipopolysaccharide export system protein LptA
MSRRYSRQALWLCAALTILVSPPLCGEDLTFSANRMESVTAEGREQIVLTGNARVASPKFEIEAETIEIFGEDQRYVTSTGDVAVVDLENDLYLTCTELFYDRSLDFVRASGSAYMEDRPNEVVVKGELIQNWNDIDLTEISVNVRILGVDYTARSQFARYRRGADTLELSGTPEVFWKGDEYRATRILIDLNNDDITFLGDVRATVHQETEEEAAEETAEESAERPAGSEQSAEPPADATDGGDEADSSEEARE